MSTNDETAKAAQEAAKAAREIAKTIGKTIDNPEPAARFLEATFGPIAEGWWLTASAFREKRLYLEEKWRLVNAYKIADLARAKREELGWSEQQIRPLSPRIAYEFRDGIETEDDPTIQRLWVNLIINTTRQDGPNPQRAFKEALHGMEPDDAQLLYLFAGFTMAMQRPCAFGVDPAVPDLGFYGPLVLTCSGGGESVSVKAERRIRELAANRAVAFANFRFIKDFDEQPEEDGAKLVREFVFEINWDFLRLTVAIDRLGMKELIRHSHRLHIPDPLPSPEDVEDVLAAALHKLHLTERISVTDFGLCLFEAVHEPAAAAQS